MNITELETKIKSLEEKITALEDVKEKITTLEDINEIKALQRIYIYYLDNHMLEEIFDLFSDNPEYIEATDEGRYFGKEGIRKFFTKELKTPNSPIESRFGLHLVVQGVVNLAPTGKTAHGRWQLLGLLGGPTPTAPNEKSALWLAGVYENEYIKEDGKWKFKNITFHPYFITTYEDGWAKVPHLTHDLKGARFEPDIKATEDKTYPTGYKLPCHFKNPVTCK